MGKCSTVGCKTRSGKGIRVFRFPKDPVKLGIWIRCANRPNWTPTVGSGLCEFHFADNQFFIRGGTGKRVLRHDAIPTVLGSQPNPPICEATESDPASELPMDHSYNKFAESKRNDASSEVSDDHLASSVFNGKKECLSDMDEYEEPSIWSMIDIKPLIVHPECGEDEEDRREPEDPDEASRELKACQSRIAYLESQLRNMNTKYRSVCKQNQFLRASVGSMEQDEIFWMRNKNLHGTKWSDSTLEKASKIRSACGIKGYKMLRELNYPLPALRTLYDKVQERSKLNAEEMKPEGAYVFLICPKPKEGVIT
eukprot:maker-scaffold569_size135262-snap-gene-0.18 protein:Tk03355 transcript:maker-scaffold569_size135262-snap-gene-0.18-mRNA-1 annotation:"PREDICTED: uncharacterized protein LOC102231696"